ncbi:MAG: TylF/MycF family methyltransferase [Bryobacterales bacterium]|nr:TylF/MycF family methyltransferase [Bryobacterales bacterium]
MTAWRTCPTCTPWWGGRGSRNVEQCLDSIVRDSVPGDVMECGVWRGGVTIFLRGYLKAHGIRDRLVWVADSFEGLPRPTFPRDPDMSAAVYPALAVSLEAVVGVDS